MSVHLVCIRAEVFFGYLLRPLSFFENIPLAYFTASNLVVGILIVFLGCSTGDGVSQYYVRLLCFCAQYFI